MRRALQQAVVRSCARSGAATPHNLFLSPSPESSLTVHRCRLLPTGRMSSPSIIEGRGSPS